MARWGGRVGGGRSVVSRWWQQGSSTRVARRGRARHGRARLGLARRGLATPAWAKRRRTTQAPAATQRYAPSRRRWPTTLMSSPFPRPAWAAEARAVATASAPASRHQGAPQLPPGLTVAEAFGYVLGHLADVILVPRSAGRCGAKRARPGARDARCGAPATLRYRPAFRVAVGCPAVDAAAGALKGAGRSPGAGARLGRVCRRDGRLRSQGAARRRHPTAAACAAAGRQRRQAHARRCGSG